MPFQFEGFSAPNGTFVPDEVFDVLAPELSEAELRVLLYIIRRTFGFKKDTDNISLKQMTDGITTREGRVLDRGTGLSKAGNARGIKGLTEKGIIVTTRNRSATSGDQATTYALRFKDRATASGGGEGQRRPGMPTSKRQPEVLQSAAVTSLAPVSTVETGGCLPNRQGGVHEVDTQETVWQQTDFNLSNIRKQKAAEIPKPEQPAHASPSSVNPAGLNQGSAFESLSTVLLRTRHPADEPAVSETEARDAIRAYLADIAPRFNDQAKLESSVGRAYHLYEAGNLPLGEFLSRLLEVSSSVRERMSKVRNRANGGKATMPYYFACLEDRLGLRKRGRGERAARSNSVMPARNAQFSPASASSLAGEQGGKSPPPHTHSFARPLPQVGRAQSGQSSVDGRSASAARS